MAIHRIFCVLFLLIIFNVEFLIGQSTLDIQGHRGCRGLLPENTMVAFIKAIDLGVTTLEMDVVITKDNKVILSHDAYLNHEICEGPHHETITEKNEKEFNLYQMTYEAIQQCDCGSKIHPRFLTQQKLQAFKPLLETVIDSIENYLAFKHLKPIYYNIETKCLPETDSIYHPTPSVFTDLVYHIIQKKNTSSRTTLQSFDIRTLQYAHQHHYPVKLALLVENKNGFEKNIRLLGFRPDVYSPDYRLVNKALITKCHQNNIQIIPWTINEVKDIKRMMRLNVDGIISDYPDRVVQIKLLL